jgi:hypothetical protein
MYELQIDNHPVRTDDEGRFSLIDLWKISGGEEKYRPAQFFLRKSTKELIDVLNIENPMFKPVIRKSGRYGGTWVCKEIVYEYAMWLNPKFKMKVIRAFHALVEGSAEKARAIAIDRLQLIELIEKRDKLELHHRGSWTDKTKDEFQRLTNEISNISSMAGASLGTISGKGKKYSDEKMLEISRTVQIDMFKDTV